MGMRKQNARPRTSPKRKRRRSRRLVRPPNLSAIRGITPGREAEDRAFLLRYACTIETDLPEHYQSMLELVSGDLSRFGEETFRLHLSEIVDLHRRRFAHHEGNISSYVANIKKGLGTISEATACLDSLLASFVRLDIDHMELVAFLLKRFAVSDFWTSLPLVRLKELQVELGILKFAIMSATGVEEKSSRGRPHVEYLFAAWELMDLWEAVTRLNVPSPKGRAKGKDGREEATQPSTAFVHLGLRMMDPNATLSKAMTSIARVREIKEEIKRPRYRNSLDSLAKLAETISKDGRGA